MFKVGESLIYPPKGVGFVKAIENIGVDGKQVPCYVIKLTKQTLGDFKLMVPVNGSKGAKLRYPVREKGIPRILRTLSSSEGKELPPDYWDRFQLIKRRLESGRPHRLAEVIRDLEPRKDLSGSETTFLMSARLQLIEELAYVRKLPCREVEREIDDLLKRRRGKCRGKKKK